MAKKSEWRRLRRISATQASRSFSTLLDAIERGCRYVVSRRGKDICLMGPPAGQGRRATECLALLGARAPVLLDAGFAADLLEVVRGEAPEKRPAWDFRQSGRAACGVGRPR